MAFFFFLCFFIFQFPFKLSDPFHEFCLTNLSFESTYPEIHQALVCGKRLPFGDLRELFIKGGLIHLMIVSGAHLIFLEHWLSKLPLPSKLKQFFLSVCLICYALMTQLHPPILRALFSFFIKRFSQDNYLFWNSFQVTFLSTFFCLFFIPDPKDSFSLQMSVLATLLYHSCRDSLFRSFLIYLFILPVINRWQTLSSLTVLINWILAPFISSLLFPLSFLSAFMPFLYPFTDALWSFFVKILKLTEFIPLEQTLFLWSLPKDWIWFYVIGLGWFLYFLKRFSIRLKIKK